MTQKNKDQHSTDIVQSAISGREPWGAEIAILLKSGEIEITTNCFQDKDECSLPAGIKYKPRTAAHEAAIKAHGQLKVGVPHAIRLYSPDEAIMNRSFK